MYECNAGDYIFPKQLEKAMYIIMNHYACTFCTCRSWS